MRTRLTVSIVVVSLALVLIGTLAAWAQSMDLDTRRGVTERTYVGSPYDVATPYDDESDDVPAPVAKTGQMISYFPGDDGDLRRV